MSGDLIIFFFSALVAIFGAVMMIAQKNPVASVMYLILSLVAQAVCYVQLGALFLGAILVIVYAGAIMVLFLFVIMLLNLRGREDLGIPPHPMRTVSKLIITILLMVELVLAIKSVFMPTLTDGIMSQPQMTDFGAVAQVARLLYTKYMYPFQLTGVLLLVAVVGAVVMARKDEHDDVIPEGSAETPARESSQKVGR
jgi:NADH-quinone oxidoreductase subunit J